MKRLYIFAFALCISLSGPQNVILAQDVDPRVQENPVLLGLLDSNPSLLDEVLLELDSLLITETVPSTRDLSGLSSDARKIVETNPLFEVAYRKDPKRTAKLIRLIQSSNK